MKFKDRSFGIIAKIAFINNMPLCAYTYTDLLP